MGYKRVPTIYELEFKGDEYEGLVVKMKSLRVGKIRELLKLVEREDQTEEMIDGMFDLLVEGLVSWNVEDDEGPVPTTKDGLDRLDFPFVMRVAINWMEAMTGVDDELGKGLTSGANSAVPLPPMVAL